MAPTDDLSSALIAIPLQLYEGYPDDHRPLHYQSHRIRLPGRAHATLYAFPRYGIEERWLHPDPAVRIAIVATLVLGGRVRGVWLELRFDDRRPGAGATLDRSVTCIIEPQATRPVSVRALWQNCEDFRNGLWRVWFGEWRDKRYSIAPMGTLRSALSDFADIQGALRGRTRAATRIAQWGTVNSLRRSALNEPRRDWIALAQAEVPAPGHAPVLGIRIATLWRAAPDREEWQAYLSPAMADHPDAATIQTIADQIADLLPRPLWYHGAPWLTDSLQLLGWDVFVRFAPSLPSLGTAALVAVAHVFRDPLAPCDVYIILRHHRVHGYVLTAWFADVGDLQHMREADAADDDAYYAFAGCRRAVAERALYHQLIRAVGHRLPWATWGLPEPGPGHDWDPGNCGAWAPASDPEEWDEHRDPPADPCVVCQTSVATVLDPHECRSRVLCTWCAAHLTTPVCPNCRQPLTPPWIIVAPGVGRLL